MPVVVPRNNWERRGTDDLPGKAPVVHGHEPFGGSACGQSPRPAEHGLHGEVCRESPGPNGRLQCADVDVEFPRELVERQQFVLPLVMSDCFASALQRRDGDSSSSAVPWPEGLERHPQERGKLALSETDRSTQFAKLVHPSAHDAIGRACRKATSGLHDR